VSDEARAPTWVFAGLFAWEERRLTGSPRLAAESMAAHHSNEAVYYLDPVYPEAAAEVGPYRLRLHGPLWRVVGRRADAANLAEYGRLARAHPLILVSTSYHLTHAWHPMDLRPDRSVYNVLENAVALAGRPLDRHRKLLDTADLVVSNSPAVTASIGGRVEAARLLEQGMAVDPDFWRRPPAPVRWTFGFFGNLMDWIDFDALEHLAALCPTEPMLLVGPVEANVAARVRALTTRHPTVRWMPAQPYENLPGLASQMGVLLLPRVRSAVSDACDPLKLYEYLASGRPVVTSHPVSAEMAPLVYRADTPAGFAAAARTALADLRAGHPVDREARSRFLDRHTWSHRTHVMRERLLGSQRA
jgi:hypothetical protein